MAASRSEHTDPRKRKPDPGLILGAFASLLVLGALILIVNWPTKTSITETNASVSSEAKRPADTLPAPTGLMR
jgi:hypothetical protein